MEIYQVSFYVNRPCERNEDDTITAFVQASSFNEAENKVLQRYKKEFESAHIFGITRTKEDEVVIII